MNSASGPVAAFRRKDSLPMGSVIAIEKPTWVLVNERIFTQRERTA